MFKQIVLGLAIIGLGGLLMYFSGPITEFLGRSAWADEHLGGTKNAVVLFGLLLFIIGGLILFGIVSLSNPVDSVSTTL